MKLNKSLVSTLCLAGAIGLGASSIGAERTVSSRAAAPPQTRGDAERGQYIFSRAGGGGRHTVQNGPPTGGAREFPTPMAKLYSTNLPADKTTGLGNWSDRQIRDALTRGIRPDGAKLLPVMPYEAYSGMSEEDAGDLIAYLRTLKPQPKPTPARRNLAPFYPPPAPFPPFPSFPLLSP